MSQKPKLPAWLKPANKVVMFLNKRGVIFATMCILTTTGRKSGQPVSNPVSTLTIGGHRYICSVGDTDWVQNARQNPGATLRRGSKSWDVQLLEVPVEERAPILREFPSQVPGGVPFFKKTLGISGTSESFVAAGDRCRVFKIA